MKQLTCEMCGSTELMKQDGVFVCQTCGTKYSVEEAKKMMVEGTVEVKGTVKVDDSSKIDNYYKMAESAYNAGNKKEAENYCNKIIEIDPENYKAWFLKGKAAGWQSTLANDRIQETMDCFSQAIKNIPEAEKDELENVKKEAASDITSLLTALMQLSCDNFAKFPSKDNEAEILNNAQKIILYHAQASTSFGELAQGLDRKIADMMDTASLDAWNNVTVKEYTPYDTKYTCEKFVERGFSCINILNASIIKDEKNNKANIQRYKNLITITNELLKSNYRVYSNGQAFKGFVIIGNERKKCLDNIAVYQQNIRALDPDYVISKRKDPQYNAADWVPVVFGAIALAAIIITSLFCLISNI